MTVYSPIPIPNCEPTIIHNRMSTMTRATIIIWIYLRPIFSICSSRSKEEFLRVRARPSDCSVTPSSNKPRNTLTHISTVSGTSFFRFPNLAEKVPLVHSPYGGFLLEKAVSHAIRSCPSDKVHSVSLLKRCVIQKASLYLLPPLTAETLYLPSSHSANSLVGDQQLATPSC